MKQSRKALKKGGKGDCRAFPCPPPCRKTSAFLPQGLLFGDQNKKVEVLIVISRQGKMEMSVSTQRVITHLKKECKQVERAEPGLFLASHNFWLALRHGQDNICDSSF